ncbi:MAG: ABC transporter ATP-binding protein [Bacteroidetes bacterium]|nr:ABC transporter ATP-binding protein [Bacteroidota bacterium]MBS1629108.1 ABC transporter ATP-binding protein [Bacteroidota bacterium]
MKNFRRIWRYISGYNSAITGYFVCSMLSVVFSLISIGMLIPVLNVLFKDEALKPLKPNPGFIDRVGHLVNEWLLAGGDKVRTLAIICGIVVLFTVLKNVFLYLSYYILIPVRHSVIRKLRNQIFEKLLSLPIGYFTEERKGDLISRMTNDVNEIQISVVSFLEVFIREPLNVTLTLAVMIYISPQLSLFLLIFLPLSGLIVGRVGSRLRRAARGISGQMADITSVLDETLSGMRVVKAFNAEKSQYLRFLKLNNENYRLRNVSARLGELASPLSETLGIAVVAIILWFGGRLVIRHETMLTAELFITYIVMFTQIINPVKNLISAINQVNKGSASLERMEEVLAVNNTVKEAPDALPVKAFNDAIELRHVRFAYGDKVILDDINLRIEKGKTIALVGSSGAGKSTLADLIPRFHDVSSGEILIDGINIKKLKLDELRRLIGVVSQEPILFNDTLYNNITLGTGGATEVQVKDAARIAHADKFISAKPDGYKTFAGDRGARLSGGERQRITIARAVLKNPPIMILDEATSSLDTESERIVQQAINNLMQDRTSIVIAHRLSTVQNADEIIVLDKGRIVERGRHDTLLAQGGIYSKLVAMQQVK